MAGNDVYEGTAHSNSSSDSDHGAEIQRQMDYDPTKEKVWKTKQSLIKMCQKEVGSISSRERPLNIAVIGPPGCGKSSFLNTIFAAFNDGKWQELTATGNFGGTGKQVSQFLVSYPKRKYYTRKTDDGDEDDVLMPTFVDLKGFEDEYSDYNKELLKIVLFGRLQEFEKFPDVAECRNEGIKGLQAKFGQRNRYLKIDRIIFLCSADPKGHPLPTELMKCLSEVARSETHIPIFGVLTMADKFNENDPAVQAREKDFLHHLGIPETRFARVKNYCKDVVPDMRYRFRVVPQLDVRALDLMHQVFSDSLPVLNPNADPYDNEESLRQPVEQSRQNTAAPITSIRSSTSSGFNWQILTMLITIQVLLIAIIVPFCLKPSIDSAKMNTVCAKYDMMKKKNGERWDELDQICAQKTDILKPAIGTLCVWLAFVIVVVPLSFHYIYQRYSREK